VLELRASITPVGGSIEGVERAPGSSASDLGTGCHGLRAETKLSQDARSEQVQARYGQHEVRGVLPYPPSSRMLEALWSPPAYTRLTLVRR